MWKNIRRLQGKEHGRREAIVYQEGKEMEEEEAWQQIVKNWVGICQMNVDNVLGVWEGGWERA